MLILSSRAGNGHQEAARAVQSILGSTFREIKVIYPLDLVRTRNLPLVGSLPLGELWEKGYNRMIQKGWMQTTSKVTWYVGPIFNKMVSYFCLSNELRSVFRREQPDLIISVSHAGNRDALIAAEKSVPKSSTERGIPYIMVTTDVDVKNWWPGEEDVENGDYPKLRVIVGPDLPTTKELLVNRGIPREHIRLGGFPLRESFLQTKRSSELSKEERDAICKEFNLPPDKRIIVIMMGGVGSPKTRLYVDELLEGAKEPNSPLSKCHLVAMCGRDEKTRTDLEALAKTASLPLTAIGFTSEVPRILSIADVFATKPGPGSADEAAFMGVPMLVDGTSEPLFWEAPVLTMTEEKKLGLVVKNKEEIAKKATEILTRKWSIPPVRYQFPDTLRDCINEVCPKARSLSGLTD